MTFDISLKKLYKFVIEIRYRIFNKTRENVMNYVKIKVRAFSCTKYMAAMSLLYPSHDAADELTGGKQRPWPLARSKYLIKLKKKEKNVFFMQTYRKNVAV